MSNLQVLTKTSAGAAAILSCAIQDTGTGILAGTTTFDKGLVQTMIPLSNGSGLKLTIARYLTPKKKDINEKGIQPDVVVGNRDNLPGDEQLDRAVEPGREKLVNMAGNEDVIALR